MEPTLFLNLFAMIKQNRVRVLISSVVLIISNFLIIANPLVFRIAITKVQLGWDRSIFYWGFALISIAFVAAVLKYYARVSFFTVARDGERNVRSKVYSRIQMQSMAFFDKHGTGELLSRLTNDINYYRDAVGLGLFFPLYCLTLIIPSWIALFLISVPLTFVSLIPFVLFPLFNSSVRNYVFNLSIGIQRKLADLSNLAQEHFTGIKVIRSYVMENACSKLFSKLCRQLIQYNLKFITLMGEIIPIFFFLTRVITVLLILLSGAIILKGWGILTTADFISFMWIQSYIYFPILIAGWILPIFAKGSSAYQRLEEIYSEPITVQEGPKNLQIPPEADIDLKDLSFSYPESDKDALLNLNLRIKGGSFVGLTGPIGSGKSTLLRLLNREYEIPRDHIFIGGHDIRDYTFQALRQAIVTVEQAPFLFSKSIGENVKFGKEEATQIEIERVSELADLHTTVMEFPQKYETEIGERGATLSGGQKQRIALARAFLVNRSIFLLDDIFSAVDAATERKIFTTLKKNFAGKTVLLVTHRVSILEQMDRVIYMHEGQIKEDGTPQELVKQKGSYAALVELQRFVHEK